MTALEFLNDMGGTNFYNIDTLNSPIPTMEAYANHKYKGLLFELNKINTNWDELRDKYNEEFLKERSHLK